VGSNPASRATYSAVFTFGGRAARWKDQALNQKRSAV